jgi:hypothetical protein
MLMGCKWNEVEEQKRQKTKIKKTEIPFVWDISSLQYSRKISLKLH